MQRHHRGTPPTEASRGRAGGLADASLSIAARDERRRLRRRLRAVRRALPPAVQRTAAQRLARRLAAARWLRQHERCTAYHADDGELDPRVFQRRHRAGNALALPRIVAGRLRFGAAVRGRAPGRYGILAPRGATQPSWRFAVVLLPLVGFNRTGARLGRGGGYYDRALAERPGRPRPLRVGLGFAFQETAHLQSAGWDARLDIIVTPEATIVVRPAVAVRARVVAGGWGQAVD